MRKSSGKRKLFDGYFKIKSLFKAKHNGAEISQDTQDGRSLYEDRKISTLNLLKFVLHLSKAKIDLTNPQYKGQQMRFSEDAEPICEFFHVNNSALLGTFDGMGGSGAQKFQIDESTQVSGAAIGATITREVTFNFFNNTFQEIPNDLNLEQILKNDLKESIETGLNERLLKLYEDPGNRPRVLGGLMRDLPTTLALIFAYPSGEKFFKIYSVWAGDSINFLLTAGDGLQQITADDFHEPYDSLSRIRIGPTLSNMVQATIKENRDFSLNVFSLDLTEPFILLSVSDGAFDYFPNPAGFESLLLKCLYLAKDIEEWKSLLTEEYKTLAQDDVTMSLMAFGYDSFEFLKCAFMDRLKYMEKLSQIIESGSERSEQNQENPCPASEELTGLPTGNLPKTSDGNIDTDALIWEKYRPAYECYLADIRKHLGNETEDFREHTEESDGKNSETKDSDDFSEKNVKDDFTC